MFNTDMILWQAKGTNSATTDMWSTNHNMPAFDQKNNLQSTFVVNTNNTVSFTTTRAMDTKDSQDYAVQYDQQILMTYAVSRTGFSNFAQHRKYGWYSL